MHLVSSLQALRPRQPSIGLVPVFLRLWPMLTHIDIHTHTQSQDNGQDAHNCSLHVFGQFPWCALLWFDQRRCDSHISYIQGREMTWNTRVRRSEAEMKVSRKVPAHSAPLMQPDGFSALWSFSIWVERTLLQQSVRRLARLYSDFCRHQDAACCVWVVFFLWDAEGPCPRNYIITTTLV